MSKFDSQASQAKRKPAPMPAQLRQERMVREIRGDATAPDAPNDAPQGAEGALDAMRAREDRVFGATPTLETIRQAARARMVSPWAVLGNVCARVISQTPANVVLPPIVGSDASLNLAAAVVSSSGGGKTAAAGVAEDVLAGRPESVEQHSRAHHKVPAERIGPGSGEGIVASFLEWVDVPGAEPGKVTKELRLKAEPNVLMVADEIARVDAVQSRSGATMGGTLRSLVTGDDLTTTNASRERNRKVPAHSYRGCAVVGVQPELSGILLDDADAGTPQRWVWLPADDPLAPPLADLPEFPEPLLWLPPAYPQEPAGGRVRLTVCDTARDAIREARHARLRGQGDALDGHALLTREKVAAALAILHGEAEVTDQWWEIAGAVMEVSDDVRRECQEALAAKSNERVRAQGRADAIRENARAEQQAHGLTEQARKVWRAAHEHHNAEQRLPNQKHDPGAGCTRRCFTHALRHAAGCNPDAAIEHAIAQGWLDESEAEPVRYVPGTSRPADGGDR